MSARPVCFMFRSLIPLRCYNAYVPTSPTFHAVDVEHKNWDEILPLVTYTCNTAQQETTQTTPFRLLYGREVTTMLDAMLQHACDNGETNADYITRRTEEARQLTRIRICRQRE